MKILEFLGNNWWWMLLLVLAFLLLRGTIRYARGESFWSFRRRTTEEDEEETEETATVPERTPRRWPRWNWKIAGYIFAFLALFLVVGLIKTLLGNWRANQSEKNRIELAEIELKKDQIISEMPEEKRNGIEKSQTKNPEAKRKYPVGHSIVVTIQCGETKTIETGNQPYKRLGLSGQTECLEVSSNNFSWHKVPYTFNRSPQKEFIRNKGTSPVRVEYVFQ